MDKIYVFAIIFQSEDVGQSSSSPDILHEDRPPRDCSTSPSSLLRESPEPHTSTSPDIISSGPQQNSSASSSTPIMMDNQRSSGNMSPDQPSRDIGSGGRSDSPMENRRSPSPESVGEGMRVPPPPPPVSFAQSVFSFGDR